MDHADPARVTELILDSSKISSISQLAKDSGYKNNLSQYKHVYSLSMNNCGLTTLAGFPTLIDLEKLYLMDNKLSGGLEHLAKANLASLRSLDLSNNSKIATLEVLKPLAEIKTLDKLNLIECGITKIPRYRQCIFELLPQLQILDDMDKDGNEVESDDEESDEDASNGEPEEDGSLGPSDSEEDEEAVDSDDQELDSDELEDDPVAETAKHIEEDDEDDEDDEQDEEDQVEDTDEAEQESTISSRTHSRRQTSEFDFDDKELGIGILVGHQELPEEHNDVEYEPPPLDDEFPFDFTGADELEDYGRKRDREEDLDDFVSEEWQSKKKK